MAEKSKKTPKKMPKQMPRQQQQQQQRQEQGMGRSGPNPNERMDDQRDRDRRHGQN
ncbi:hypothetical protein [Nocardia lijiangensis]|uniref:hypothetical protein n=1 Tax=Nocardia lijiangensis TaxID=299618 RepID=UPI000A970A1F|nr:hypothetical protein [Nocardia lijiangensis]